MKKFSFLLLLTLIIQSCSSTKYADLGDGIFADIQTNKGDIVVKLFYKETPLTVANFVSLAEGTNTYVSEDLKGKKYYDSVIFHRVIKDFMIQSGDPTGTGRGGPGYKFEDEFVDSLTHDKKGILSMANAGPNTNGSQFFITQVPTPHLNGKHTVFGEVVKGLEVIDSIADAPMSKANPSRPETDIVMNHVVIVRNGKEARKFDDQAILAEYFGKAEAEAKKIAEARQALVDEFKTQEAIADSTKTGLKFIQLTPGTDEKPSLNQTALINYAGYYAESGELFDTSWLEVAEDCGSVNPQKKAAGAYRPVPMKISPDAQLVAGFKEGLFLLHKGEKIRIFIPSHLGYGEAGYGPIPPNTDLVFDLEMVDIQE
ncbi:peptidylprolyl isomerase [Robertkochia solimangrovi]|uniref:peptidylprolyl isomerase n=1 Tax=Robertkochia solimangrovi TaxID=2213046 RepID=UPI0011803D54|nr:peptidylprolyl isomerase [Robertkochia solimangrovi]TRZ43599.1 peptidylprolyl isomerase [Robertkochia solimangrovi]